MISYTLWSFTRIEAFSFAVLSTAEEKLSSYLRDLSDSSEAGGDIKNYDIISL